MDKTDETSSSTNNTNVSDTDYFETKKADLNKKRSSSTLSAVAGILMSTVVGASDGNAMFGEEGNVFEGVTYKPISSPLVLVLSGSRLTPEEFYQETKKRASVVSYDNTTEKELLEEIILAKETFKSGKSQKKAWALDIILNTIEPAFDLYKDKEFFRSVTMSTINDIKRKVYY